MFHAKDIKNILREVYESTLLDEVDVEDIKVMLDEMSYDKVQIILQGTDLLKHMDD